MKRPFVPVVSCYAIGLLLAGIFRPPLIALFGTAFTVLIVVLVVEKVRPFLIWPLIALAGWTNLAGRTSAVSPDDLRALLGNDEAMAAVRGTLTETPHLKISGSEDQTNV